MATAGDGVAVPRVVEIVPAKTALP